MKYAHIIKSIDDDKIKSIEQAQDNYDTNKNIRAYFETKIVNKYNKETEYLLSAAEKYNIYEDKLIRA